MTVATLTPEDLSIMARWPVYAECLYRYHDRRDAAIMRELLRFQFS